MSNSAPPDQIETSVTFVVKEYLCNYCGKVAKMFRGYDPVAYEDEYHFYCDCEDAKEEQQKRHMLEQMVWKQGKYQNDFIFYHDIMSRINGQCRTVDQFIKIHNMMAKKNYTNE